MSLRLPVGMFTSILDVHFTPYETIYGVGQNFLALGNKAEVWAVMVASRGEPRISVERKLAS